MKQRVTCDWPGILADCGPIWIESVEKQSLKDHRAWFMAKGGQESYALFPKLLSGWSLVDGTGAPLPFPLAGESGEQIEARVLDQVDVAVEGWLIFAITRMLNERRSPPLAAGSPSPVKP